MPDELLTSLGRALHRDASIPSEPLTDDISVAPNEASSEIKGKTKQSKRIPLWLWVVISKSLGIKLHSKDTPVISAVLHILTVGAGAGMVFTNAFYSGYDIMSLFTATDVVDGAVSVLMSILYCGLGVYSHRLAYRLFVHPKFLEKMRLHSKTVMKVNAALIVLVVVAAFVVVQNFSLAPFGYGFNGGNNTVVHNGTEEVNPCQKIEIPLAICQSFYVFQLLFSFFFLVWNVLVAVVLISVARTHTIDIRRFMCELAYDAHLHDKQFRKNFYRPNTNGFSDNLNEYLWVDSDNIGTMVANASMEKSTTFNEESLAATKETSATTTTSAQVHGGGGNQTVDEEEDGPPSMFSTRNVQLQLSDELNSQEGQGGGSAFNRFQRLSEEKEEDANEEEMMVPHIMSEQEIMHKYWKLVSSTRLTSLAFQRWMCVITVAILFWSTIRVVYWLTHSPTVYGVLSFILPLMLLPLLASAYAEVNYEGIKVIQTIMPTPSRIHMFQYLYGMPVQLTCYGHRISYGTMGTVLAGILAAFASKILLQEMNQVIN